MGGSEFISTNFKDTNDLIWKHIEISRKTIEARKICEIEKSLDNIDIYKEFDEDGNRIAEADSEYQ